MMAILVIVVLLSLLSALHLSGLLTGVFAPVAEAVTRRYEKMQTAAIYRRRKHMRFSVDLPARLTVEGGSPERVRLRDLSMGGARIGGVANPKLGTKARLWVEGVEVEVIFRASGAPDWVGVAFAPDPATANRAASLMDRLGLGERSFEGSSRGYSA